MTSKTPRSVRKEPKQDRARATIDAILIATAHILKTEGFSRASTNRIAELAGVSIGSLYQYFPNKHSVVGALRARHDEWFEEALNAELARILELPLRAAARSVVEILVALHVTDADLHNALAGEGRAIHSEEEQRFRVLFTSYLEAHASELRPVDFEIAGFIAVRALEAVIHTTSIDEPQRLQDPAFAREVTELLARYLEA